jgi:DNA polymerase-4
LTLFFIRSYTCQQQEHIKNMPLIDPATAPLRWLFIDMNSFFASCEQQDRPALRGRPVAVVPMVTDSTCAIAASYEAKAYGIKTGTMIAEARRRCPDLICVLARHDRYVHYHQKILTELVRHTPISRVCSVDEMASRLTREDQDEAAARALAARIKVGMANHVGAHIRCSIGLAPNAFLAKVATDMMKPDGLVVLRGDQLPGRLLDLDLIDLPGINVAMERRLWQAGIRSVADLWHAHPKQARAAWGSVMGERFWYELHGYDLPPPITHRSMVGHSRVLDPECRPVVAAWPMAERLLLKAAARLRRLGYYARILELRVRVVDGPRVALAARLDATQGNVMMVRTLHDLWAIMINQTQARMLKKIAVTLGDLCTSDQITPDLFLTHDARHGRACARDQILATTIDQLNERFGAGTVHMGLRPGAAAGYVGTKIAFNRVPDLAEFHE